MKQIVFPRMTNMFTKILYKLKQAYIKHYSAMKL